MIAGRGSRASSPPGQPGLLAAFFAGVSFEPRRHVIAVRLASCSWVGQKCNRHHGNELKLGIGLRMSRTHLKMTSPPSVHVRIAPKVREGPGGLGVNKSSVGVNDVTFGRCRAHNVYFLPPQIRFQVRLGNFKSQTWKPASDATFKAPIPPSSY